MLHRYILRPLSPWGTRLRSDTLYGLLLWRIAERQGEAACCEAIDAFRAGTPPFVVSSAMPLGRVFTPCLPPTPRATFRRWVEEEQAFCDAAGKPLELFNALQQQKRFRKLPALPLEVWTRHAANLSLRPLLQWFCQQGGEGDEEHKPTQGTSLEPHVSIDRESGGASPGGLFFNRLMWFAPGTALHLYARAQDSATLLELLREVGELGFGKDASTGKGRFSVEDDTAFDPATLANDGPDALLCSVCAAPDMRGLRGFYAVELKRGKAGPGMGSPFKSPFLLVQEGGVLQELPLGPYVLDNIHPDSRLVQVTQPLTLPCCLAPQEECHG